MILISFRSDADIFAPAAEGAIEMTTYHDKRLKPCKTCGVKPVLEHWSSGGPMFAVRCDNPDRPNSCDLAFHYSKCRNPQEAIKRWNEYQEEKHGLVHRENRDVKDRMPQPPEGE